MPTRTKEAQLVHRVALTLEEAEIPFVQEPLYRGLRPDFLVETEEGRKVIIECKIYRPDRIREAVRQAKFYAMALEADRAIVVTEGQHRTANLHGAIPIGKLKEVLRSLSKRTAFRTPKVKTTKSRGIVFCAMPFAKKYLDVYFFAMRYAASKVGAEARRADMPLVSGDVVKHVKTLIRDSIAVIADLSESRPDVLYEVGYAHALIRPTVHICSTPFARLPFTVKTWAAIPYSKGEVYALRKTLTQALRNALVTP